MATFYVLPPRECLEHALAAFTARHLPGLPAPSWDDFLELVARPDVFVVHREELAGDDLHADLATLFGAEPGDLILDVGLPTASTEPRVRRSVMPIPERLGSR